MKQKLNILSYVAGIITGIIVIVALLLVLIANYSLDFCSKYNYELMKEDSDRLEALERKRNIVYNFLDKNDAFGKRSKEDEEEAYITSAISIYNDDYIHYYSLNNKKDLEELFNKSYKGFGIAFSLDGNTNNLTITEVNENSSAYKQGIKAGDILYKYNDKLVSKMTPKEFTRMLDIKADKQAEITVMRTGKTLSFNVSKEKIAYDYVDYELKDNIPYIKLSRFEGNADKDFRKAIESLDVNKYKSLILDLRDNGGGSLEVARHIGGYFIGKNKTISTIKYRNKKDREIKTDTDRLIGKDKRIYVITNGATASASELLIMALQDYNMDIKVIGYTTFGKGIAQDIEQFPDGTALKYTVGLYLSPKGRNIHDIGIKPDITELEENKIYSLIADLERDHV